MKKKEEKKTPYLKPIGPVLKHFRTLKGLSIHDISVKLKIDTSQILAIEKSPKPGKDVVRKYCKALDITKEMIVLYCLKNSHISKNKKELFKELSPVIKDMIEHVIKMK